MIIETRPSRRGYDLIVRTNDKEASIEEDISAYDNIVPEMYPAKFLETVIEMLEFNCQSEYHIASWLLERLPQRVLEELKDILVNEEEE
jgi:hypothetical protein